MGKIGKILLWNFTLVFRRISRIADASSLSIINFAEIAWQYSVFRNSDMFTYSKMICPHLYYLSQWGWDKKQGPLEACKRLKYYCNVACLPDPPADLSTDLDLTTNFRDFSSMKNDLLFFILSLLICCLIENSCVHFK